MSEVKERPILFSAPMVKAILEGRKLMTRRASKNQNNPTLDECKYKAGDRLWVKETYASTLDKRTLIYRADSPFKEFKISDGRAWKWKPSIFMPRWASRILLEITNVKVECLQEISKKGCNKEGLKICKNMNGIAGNVGYVDEGSAYDKSGLCHSSPIVAFQMLWDSINSKDETKCWSSNPYVWCIEFRRVN